MHALAAALVLAACAAKKASKVKATKPPNEYSTKNTTIAASPWRRIADADEPEIQAATGLPACLANDSVQLGIALVVAFLVTGAALRARFRHDDAYDGPPGVQASPYVGVA